MATRFCPPTGAAHESVEPGRASAALRGCCCGFERWQAAGPSKRNATKTLLRKVENAATLVMASPTDDGAPSGPCLSTPLPHAQVAIRTRNDREPRYACGALQGLGLGMLMGSLSGAAFRPCEWRRSVRRRQLPHHA